MKMCYSYRLKNALIGIMIFVNLAFACTNDFLERLPTEKKENSLKLNTRFSLEFSYSSYKEDSAVNNQLLVFNNSNILESSGIPEPQSKNKLIEDQRNFLKSLQWAAVFQYELVPNRDAIKPFYLKCVKNCKSGSDENFYVAAQANGQLTLKSGTQNATQFYSDGENELIKSGHFTNAVDKFNDENLALKAWPVLDHTNQRVNARWRQFCLKRPIEKTEETAKCGEFVTENAWNVSYDLPGEAPHSYLTIATYGCKKGYGFSKTSNPFSERHEREQVICVGGSWKSFGEKKDNEPSIRWKEPETCKPSSCANSINPMHAKVQYMANDQRFTESDSHATITCNSGYFFTSAKQTKLAFTGSVDCSLGDWEEWKCEKGCHIDSIATQTIDEIQTIEKIEVTNPKDCIDSLCKKGGIATMHCKIHSRDEVSEFQKINPKIPDRFKIPKFVTEDLKSSGQTTCEAAGWKNICTQKVLIKNSANDKPEKIAL